MPVEDFLNQRSDGEDNAEGTRWAVLIAGSAGYYNYRHQADVCHAYQLLREDGLKEENIVVFMYDDIALDPENPMPGIIINNPDGVNVYEGVPKDYTKGDVTVDNFFAVLLGNRTALSGGSGKVVDSGPNDHVFIFYTDHGGPGVLGMPNTPYLYADDFVDTLKKKHASGSYRKMVIYVEACESGSIVEGLLPQGMNIYVTTASNAEESSWGTYCPGMYPSPPPGFDVCIGDLYSVSWMEDSEVHNLQRETLLDQYLTVKRRTSDQNTYQIGSHVMQYGDTMINKEELSLYLGFNPATADLPAVSPNLDRFKLPRGLELFLAGKPSSGVHQRDADLLQLWHKYANAPEASEKKADAQREMVKVMARRAHIDRGVNLIGDILFGSEVGSTILTAVRPAGQPLVDDWSCLKSMVRAFEGKCGLLTQYGMKHMRAFANMCNAGKDASAVMAAAGEACSLNSYSLSDVNWAPATDNFSA
ncbi:hypothetical protein O6H91_01G093100 [Diphasiastrum complanatum]|nr:hypothetical protein O6H91_01G093100 [Diphasiastrum complanatum]